MGKRIVIIYSLAVLCFSMLSVKITTIISNSELSEAGTNQSSYLLEIGKNRGGIYDYSMKPLVNKQSYYVAAVLPGNESKTAILNNIDNTNREMAISKFQQGIPFTCPVPSKNIYSRGVDIFKMYQRYQNNQLAVHLIGQIDRSTGEGTNGLELALNDYLISRGGKISMRYPTDGRMQSLSAGEIIDTGYDSGAGVILTIDSHIQNIAEQAAKDIEKGSVIVQDCNNGNILAAVSLPLYNPNDIAASLNSKNSPFVNRSFSAYSVGSSFKMLVAATALEKGFSTDRQYECKGYIMAGEQKINCSRLIGHGVIGMREAFNKSCNPYFISMALQIGGNDIAYKASQLGFGTPIEFLPTFKTKSGELPTYEELKVPAAIANLGFGQGKLLATPIHISSMVSSIANGGKYFYPRLIEGYTEDGKNFSSHTPVYSATQVFTKSSADYVKNFLIKVVEEGSGTPAKPKQGGAGGKTASAQSGQFVDGEEVIQAWFTGFYPAESPRYTITVLVEGGDSGSDTACPIFKDICDNL